jgi:hypothetical protein
MHTYVSNHKIIVGFGVAAPLTNRADAKTVATTSPTHLTKAQRDATIGFRLVEFGYQTLDNLARHTQ